MINSSEVKHSKSAIALSNFLFPDTKQSNTVRLRRLSVETGRGKRGKRRN
jgi:hypothetical protein